MLPARAGGLAGEGAGEVQSTAQEGHSAEALMGGAREVFSHDFLAIVCQNTELLSVQ